jgi:hypothetical protein
MPAGEVLSTVRSLAAANATKTARVVIDPDGIEALPLPSLEPWPELDDAALYGLAGEIVRRIEPQTEAHPVALLVHLLVMFGNVIGRSAHMVADGAKHYTNLFACLVGLSAHGRKGTAEARSRGVLQPLDPVWCQGIANGLSSGEGLISSVRDPVEGLRSIKGDDGAVSLETEILDAGVTDKRLLVIESEFASVLKAARREGSTLSPLMRQAWDRGDLRTLTKHDPLKATGAHISLIGHVTAPELTRYLTETELANGFANRILWPAVRRSKLLAEGGQPVELGDLVDRLKVMAEFARGVKEMRRTDEAKRKWSKVYPQLTGGRHGLFGAVTSRAEAQVLRLSLIYALLDASAEVRPQHLAAALGLWQYCEASAKRIFGESLGNPFADKVLELVRVRPGISRTQLHDELQRHHGPKLLKTLAELRQIELIHSKRQPTGGRSKEVWFPGPDPASEGEENGHSSGPLNGAPSSGTSPPQPAVPEAAASDGPSGTQEVVEL